jgi:hypothetical protein
VLADSNSVPHVGGAPAHPSIAKPVQTVQPVRPVTVKPAVQTEKPAVQKPAVQTEKPAVQKPAVQTEKPAVQKPAVQTEKPTVQTEKPAIQKPAVLKPAVQKPAVQKPAVQKPIASPAAAPVKSMHHPLPTPLIPNATSAVLKRAASPCSGFPFAPNFNGLTCECFQNGTNCTVSLDCLAGTPPINCCCEPMTSSGCNAQDSCVCGAGSSCLTPPNTRCFTDVCCDPTKVRNVFW